MKTKELKTATAILSIEVNVNCPNCDFYINILDEKDTAGFNHNDEGEILNQALPSGNWVASHDEFKVQNIKCSSCKKDFNVLGIEW